MRRLLISMIDLYRSRWSERYAGACRFEPSCSNYARGVIRRHGAIVGSVLTISRLLRCRPGCASGNDPVPDKGQIMLSLKGNLVDGGTDKDC